jgi:hypothetical protein
MRFDDMGPDVADIGPPPPRPPVEIPALDPPARGLSRLTRRVRGGSDDGDELDRDKRAWDFADDGDLGGDLDGAARADRAGGRAVATDDPPRRRRRIDPHEDDE